LRGAIPLLSLPTEAEAVSVLPEPVVPEFIDPEAVEPDRVPEFIEPEVAPGLAGLGLAVDPEFTEPPLLLTPGPELAVEEGLPVLPVPLDWA
jgi:hypothetical protein